MSRATPPMRHFAKRLIVFETRQNTSFATQPRPVVPVQEKLRPQLVALLGNVGFQTLLGRALALAKPEIPWLRAVQVNENGCMEGLEELQRQIGADEFLEGKVVLLAQLLGLLVAFIGQNLTLRLVREVWPKIPLDGLDLETGGKNEKTK